MPNYHDKFLLEFNIEFIYDSIQEQLIRFKIPCLRFVKSFPVSPFNYDCDYSYDYDKGNYY